MLHIKVDKARLVASLRTVKMIIDHEQKRCSSDPYYLSQIWLYLYIFVHR
jgi:hypothetical protein